MDDYAEKYFGKMYKPFMVAGAKFSGEFDIPECPCTAKSIPQYLIYYNQIPEDYKSNAFVHFYMYDYEFESIWNHPKSALQKLKRCSGIITPDFSTYQDMPAALKIYNTYRMRAFGYINNVRWGTPETFKYCFDGIPKNSIVCVSTVGCLYEQRDEERFTEGLKVMVETLNPTDILVYGKKGRTFFDYYKEHGIHVKFYDPPPTHSFTTKEVVKIYP